FILRESESRTAKIAIPVANDGGEYSNALKWLCACRDQKTEPGHVRQEAWLYARRIARGDRHHRRSGGVAFARRSIGSRGVAAVEMCQQSEADWPGDAQL